MGGFRLVKNRHHLCSLWAISLLWILLLALTQSDLPPWIGMVTFLTMSLIHLSCFLIHPNRSQIGGRTLLIFFLFTRLSSFFSQPLFEDDYYRYLWDGIVGSHLGNALVISPDEVLLETNMVVNEPWRSEEISWRRQLLPRNDLTDLLLKINHPESPSIYGPAGQILLAVHNLPLRVLDSLYDNWTPSLTFRVQWLRAFLITLEAYALFLFLRWSRLRGWGNGPTLLLVSCPLLLKEVSNSLHLDILPMLLVLGALLAYEKKKCSGPILLALATGVKAYSFVLLPIFLIRSPRPFRDTFLYATTLGVLYLPFLYSGGEEIFSGTRYFSHQWSMNDGLTALFREVLYHTLGEEFYKTTLAPIGAIEVSSVQSLSRKIGLGLFLFFAVGLTLKRRHSLRSHGTFLTTLSDLLFLLIICSPVQNPWYLIWGLPFFIASQRKAAMVMVALSPLYLSNFIWEPSSHLLHDPFQWWVIIPQILCLAVFINEISVSRTSQLPKVPEEDTHTWAHDHWTRREK